MIVGENPDVLFQGLVDTFCLSVAFQMVSRSEMEFHVQGFAERSKEVRDKLRAMIRCNMGRNTMYGKYMDNKEFSQLSRSDGVVCGDENALLCEMIYHYQDSSKPFGNWEVFNEIHGNRIPQTGRDRKLMEKTIRLVVLGLVPRTSCTRSTIVSDKVRILGQVYSQQINARVLLMPKCPETG